MAETAIKPAKRSYFPGGTREANGKEYQYDARIIYRRDNYDSRASTLYEIAQELIAECATFDPPLIVEMSDIEFEMYGGERHLGQMGAEVRVPADTKVPDTYFNWGTMGTAEAGFPRL